MRIRTTTRNTESRCGAVAVEFAVVAPMLLAVVVGLIELTRVYDVQNTLEAAAREGARFAAMDRTGLIQEGQSTNSKLIQDVTDLLASSGIPAGAIQVTIRDGEDSSQGFDIDDPDNNLRLFTVEIEVPYSQISYTSVGAAHDYGLTAAVTFRNGGATVSQ